MMDTLFLVAHRDREYSLRSRLSSCLHLSNIIKTHQQLRIKLQDLVLVLQSNALKLQKLLLQFLDQALMYYQLELGMSLLVSHWPRNSSHLLRIQLLQRFLDQVPMMETIETPNIKTLHGVSVHLLEMMKKKL